MTNFKASLADSAANENDVWYMKAGIKRAWMPAGATVLFGEWGRYEDQFTGLCGVPGASNETTSSRPPPALLASRLCRSASFRAANSRVKFFFVTAAVTGSTVDRWGLGVVQEINSAAMHVFARWQHLDLDLSATDLRLSRLNDNGLAVRNKNFGKNFGTSWEGLDIFQVGGVIFF